MSTNMMHPTQFGGVTASYCTSTCTDTYCTDPSSLPPFDTSPHHLHQAHQGAP